MKNGGYYVVVQLVAMLHVNTSYDRLMTTDGWIRTLGNYQHPHITGAMYNCMILEYDELGVKAPTSIKKAYNPAVYDELKTLGYGIHIIHINETGNNQTTCNEPEQPEPHTPPEESTGPFKIVKSYRIRNTDTNVLTDKGTFWKDDSAAKIKIEDEDSWTMIGWKTSTTYDKNIESTTWETSVLFSILENKIGGILQGK